MSYTETAKELDAKIKALYADIDACVKERILLAAAEISGAPVEPLKDMFIANCRSGYCRCRAIRNIVAGTDGL